MSALWHCFCDETCTVKPHRYLAVGAIIVRAEHSVRLQESIGLWRTQAKMLSELKWSKIKPQKYSEYSDFARRSTRAVTRGMISFAALTADRHQIDHKTYNDGDENTGYNKLFYQLVLHRMLGRMNPLDRLIVYPDKKHDESSYDELKSALNNGIRKKFGRQRYEVVDVQGICSKKHNLAQVNDLFLGAVGCHTNGHHLKSKLSPTKLLLAREIADGVGLDSLCDPTPIGLTKFQIWRFQLRPRTQKGAASPNR